MLPCGPCRRMSSVSIPPSPKRIRDPRKDALRRQHGGASPSTGSNSSTRPRNFTGSICSGASRSSRRSSGVGRTPRAQAQRTARTLLAIAEDGGNPGVSTRGSAGSAPSRQERSRLLLQLPVEPRRVVPRSAARLGPRCRSATRQFLGRLAPRSSPHRQTLRSNVQFDRQPRGLAAKSVRCAAGHRCQHHRVRTLGPVPA